MKTLLSALFLFFTAFSAFCDPMVADPDALTSFREQRDEAFANLDMAETAGVGLLMVIMVGFVVLTLCAGYSQKSKRMAVVLIASLVPALSYAEGGGRHVNRNVNHNNSNANASVTEFSPPMYDLQGFVEWKRYQQERKAYSRTKKGASLSPLDSQAPHTMPAAAPAGDAQTRYNNFLRSKGINPNTIGHATVVAGRMIVPTIEEQYAIRNGIYAERLAGCRDPYAAVIVLENRPGYYTPNNDYYWPNY